MGKTDKKQTPKSYQVHCAREPLICEAYERSADDKNYDPKEDAKEIFDFLGRLPSKTISALEKIWGEQEKSLKNFCNENKFLCRDQEDKK